MAFRSERQRRAFFATGNFSRSPTTPTVSGTAFSYRDGRNLGKFNNLEEVFNKFPSEKKAFMRVMKFRKQTGKQVNNIEEIKQVKRKENPRWDSR